MPALSKEIKIWKVNITWFRIKSNFISLECETPGWSQEQVWRNGKFGVLSLMTGKKTLKPADVLADEGIIAMAAVTHDTLMDNKWCQMSSGSQ